MLTGRLFRFRAVFAVLDTQATAEGPPGYNTTFREPKVSYDAAGNRVEGRKERIVAVRAQIETGQFRNQVLTPFGMDVQTSFNVVTRSQYLRDVGLLDEKGVCAIVPQSRLVRVETLEEELIDNYEVRDGKGNLLSGVYVKETSPTDYGFTRNRDLWVFKLENRKVSAGEG